mmetsp:Transcript_7367/g.10525  ORF Transcript_7367/g.10525 Transcript_7367/m.10525 type:complete len:252 (-) Transcript_7367:125-880(-)
MACGAFYGSLTTLTCFSQPKTGNKDRPKPLAPTCNVCLIRDDLTTIWCEVTSSMRTRSLQEDTDPMVETPISTSPVTTTTGLSSTSGNSSGGGSKTPTGPASPSPSPPSDSVTDQSKDEIKELLLCLRPLRDGEEKVDESFRFVPATVTSSDPSDSQQETGTSTITTGSSTPNASSTAGSGHSASNSAADSNGSTNSADSATKISGKVRPPKKRRIVTTGSDNNSPNKKSRVSTATEKSVVESLMLMSHNP